MGLWKPSLTSTGGAGMQLHPQPNVATKENNAQIG